MLQSAIDVNRGAISLRNEGEDQRDRRGLAFDGLRLRFFADGGDRVVGPVRIWNAHFETAGNLIRRPGKMRPIHTLDAIPLAVALSIPHPTPIEHFVCADQRLCDLAALEGLAVLNPELP